MYVVAIHLVRVLEFEHLVRSILGDELIERSCYHRLILSLKIF
jgi:hypothetical protein